MRELREALERLNAAPKVMEPGTYDIAGHINRVLAADLALQAVRRPGALELLALLDGPDDATVERFAAWFRKNYPGPDTVIHKPDWHAPRIFRAALAAVKEGA